MQFRAALMVSVSFGIVSFLAIALGAQATAVASSPTGRSEAPFCTAGALLAGSCVGQGYLRPNHLTDRIPCSVDAEAVDSASSPVTCSVPLPGCETVPVDTLDPYLCVDPSEATVEGLLASAGSSAGALLPPEDEAEPETEDGAVDESESEEPLTDDVEEIRSGAAALEPALPDAEPVVEDLLSTVSILSPIEVKTADADSSKAAPGAFDPAPAVEPPAPEDDVRAGPPASASNHLWTLLLLFGVAAAVGLHQWRMFSPLLA